VEVVEVGEVKEASLLLHEYKYTRLHPSEAAGEEVLSAGYLFFSPSPPFYIFNLVTASLISLDLKPPRETGRERYRRKMRGEQTASNLVKVSFEKSIFLCDKICLRLFAL